MHKQTAHHVLPPQEQKRIDLEKIEELLRKHNLEENVDLIYVLLKEFRLSDEKDQIDTCIQKVVDQYIEEKRIIREEDPNKYDIYSKK